MTEGNKMCYNWETLVQWHCYHASKTVLTIGNRLSSWPRGFHVVCGSAHWPPNTQKAELDDKSHRTEGPLLSPRSKRRLLNQRICYLHRRCESHDGKRKGGGARGGCLEMEKQGHDETTNECQSHACVLAHCTIYVHLIEEEGILGNGAQI